MGRRLSTILPELTFVLLILCGVAAYRYGSLLPAFTSEAAAMQLFGSADAGGRCGSEAWWNGMDALRTSRYPFMDGGIGLILAGVTFEALRLALKLSRVPNCPELRTPQKHWMFIWIGIGASLLGFFALAMTFIIDLQRFVFPWCADSIGIPLGGVAMMAMITIPILVLIGLLITRFFGQLPTKLFAWDPLRLRRSIMVTALTGLGGAIGLFLTVAAIPTSSFLVVPSGIIALYLLASTQAALLAPEMEQAAK